MYDGCALGSWRCPLRPQRVSGPFVNVQVLTNPNPNPNPNLSPNPNPNPNPRLPPASGAWLSGFRVRAPPQPRVWADQTDPLVITVATYEEAPPRLDLRDLSEALQQEGGNVGAPTPRFVARFVVPSVREGTMLHFDFADAVRFVPWSFLLHFSSHWANLGSLWLARVSTRGGTKGLGQGQG